MSNQKIALVHDYLITYGGAERVLEALHEIWPDAPIYTAWADHKWLNKNLLFQHTIVSEKGKKKKKRIKIICSWFDKIPFKKLLCSPLRFLAPLIWKDIAKKIEKENFNAVISSSAWYIAKGVALGNYKFQSASWRTNPKQIQNSNKKKINRSQESRKLEIRNLELEIRRKPFQICYCHTPPRYLYGYDTSRDSKRPLVRLYANLVNPFMRYYDFKSSQSVDLFIANSEEVKQRIWKFYRKKAVVIYPPENTKHQAPIRRLADKSQTKPKFKTQNTKKRITDYYLVVNRLVKSKNTDIAVESCQKAGVKLKIAGEGPEEKNLESRIMNYELKSKKKGLIELLGYVDEEELVELYQYCKAGVYLPRDEDFGIVPVEAMSFGKPVIGVNGGGVKETVINGKTGLLVDEARVDLVREAIKKIEIDGTRDAWSIACKKQAEKFGKERFKKAILEIVNKSTL